MQTDTSEKWGIVTVTYNSASYLRRCWRFGSIGDAQWIVVDNSSTDGSASLASHLGARVVELRSNVGFSKANNIGLSQIDRKWVAFVNPDVRIPNPQDLSRLASVSRANGAFVAPQLLNPDGTEQPNARGFPFILDKVAHRKLHLPGSQLDRYIRLGLQSPVYAVWAMGDLHEWSDGDVSRPRGMERGLLLILRGHQFGLRAWRAGIPIVLDPAVRWSHQWVRATKGLSVAAWRRG